MTTPKFTEKQTDILLKFMIFVIAYFLVAKPLFNFLGITKSKGDKLKAKVGSDPGSPFNITYFQKNGGNKITVKRKKEIQGYAKSIRNAMGFWVDTEPDIVYAIHSCKSKNEISILSYLFNLTYKKDLFAFLSDGLGYMPQNGLSDYDLAIIITYVNSLPKN